MQHVLEKVMVVIFRDRREAGQALGAELGKYAGRTDVAVLGLPRGGVPVAFEVAKALAAPLDVFLVRKLGTPGQPELAMGAIASGGVRILNTDVIDALGIEPEEIEAVAEREMLELRRREHLYRGDRPPLELEGRTAILVDDGLATGSSMHAAVAAVRRLRPARIIVAVPVAPSSTVREMGTSADEVVVLSTPEPFGAVGRFYREFDPTGDNEVKALLRRSAAAFAMEEHPA